MGFESLPISVIIPNYNGAPYLKSCLESLLRQTRRPLEILIVDNASTDDSVDVARLVAPECRILRLDANGGFAGAVNAGLRAARADWAAVLNNDTEVAPDWLFECSAAIRRHEDAAFLACRILDFRRDRIYSAGDCFLRAGIGYRRGQEQGARPEYSQEIEIFSACGCAALYKKDVALAAGAFDERFFAYLEDVDLTLRLRAAGHCGYYAPRALVYHYGGATSGGEFSAFSVRLRTRNSLLVLLKSVPASVLARSLPMILSAQAFWLMRVLRKRRIFSYVQGLLEAIRLAPAMLRARAELRPLWRRSQNVLWRAILESERLAQRDYEPAPAQASMFLRLYFRLFSP
jgi:GT2 family glycosyltransferase